MDLGLTGKVAMVAAGSKGIGLAVAKGLLAEGAKVSICSRDAARLDEVKAELGGELHTCVADVSKPEDIDRWVKETMSHSGPPDVLVTNTGGPPAGAWSGLTDEQWQSGFDSTLMNVVRMVRLVAPGMEERGWGRIVHITSLVAKEPSALLPISSTLRSGLMALCRLQATALAPNGVTVNAVLPGHTMTDRQTHLAEIRAKRDGISVDEALAKQAAEVPMGRLADASEIADAVLFLASQRAGYITGVNLLVDGGLVKGMA